MGFTAGRRRDIQDDLVVDRQSTRVTFAMVTDAHIPRSLQKDIVAMRVNSSVAQVCILYIEGIGDVRDLRMMIGACTCSSSWPINKS